MNKSPEQFHTNEHLSMRRSEKNLNQEPALSPEVQKICAARSESFSGIERWLKVKTRETIREKLEREKKILLDLYQRDRKARATAQENAHILNRSYFKQKSLDVSIFE